MIHFLTPYCPSKQNLGIMQNVSGLRDGSQGTGPILYMAHPVRERSADKYAAIGQNIPNAHRITRINRLRKIVRLHISMVRNFRKCGD
jgi:hypothetical protein